MATSLTTHSPEYVSNFVTESKIEAALQMVRLDMQPNVKAQENRYVCMSIGAQEWFPRMWVGQ